MKIMEFVNPNYFNIVNKFITKKSDVKLYCYKINAI